MARLQTFFIGLVLSLAAHVALAETTFPYVAYIATPQSFARCGPGQQHYPTLQLPQGHAVEVFRHDSDGWCAVRPPEGSFCWIPAHEIHRVSSTKAEVAVQTTVARVGSAISPARNAVQVMLRRGEVVQLLAAGPNDDPRWLRITPPAGEFRWIAANSLSRTPPVEGSTGVQLAAGWTRQRFDSAVRPAAGESADAFTHLLQTAPTSQPPYQGAPGVQPVAVPPPANPDAVRDTAKELFDKGVQAADAGKWEACRAALLAAWDIRPTYQVAGNLGECEAKLGRTLEAAEHLALEARLALVVSQRGHHGHPGHTPEHHHCGKWWDSFWADGDLQCWQRHAGDAHHGGVPRPRGDAVGQWHRHQQPVTRDGCVRLQRHLG